MIGMQAQLDSSPVVRSCDLLPPNIAKVPSASTLIIFIFPSYRLARGGVVANHAVNAPSGIAQQLQRSEEQNFDHMDPMSLDDLFFNESGATPFGQDQGHSPTDDMHGLTSDADAPGIPIKSRKSQLQRFSPQSVPAPSHGNEFQYVTRHHRKTSIDERPVSLRRST